MNNIFFSQRFLKAVYFLFYSLLLVSPPSNATDYTAQAYGNTPEQARHRALSALSENLQVAVKSHFYVVSTSKGENTATQTIDTHSELPLLGVKQTVIEKNGEFYCLAYLNKKDALSLYSAELVQLHDRILQLNSQINQLSDGRQKYPLLLTLLTYINQYEKFHTVARLLGDATLSSVPVSETAVRSKIMAMENDAPSLDIAAQVLTRDLPEHQYYVLPPLPQGSQQATMLSRLLRDRIRSHIKSTEKFKQGYFLKGSYEIGADAITVSCRAVNSKGETLATRLVKLAPEAYNKIDYKPKSINFSQLLHNDYVIDSSFQAQLTTNAGSEDLLFTSGQNVELFVKLSHAGYFYIVSHNLVEGVSYLLELDDVPGKRAFLRYVSADEANHWLSLSEFEVSPPFGTENLQLIASNKDLINHLPAYTYNAETGLYEIRAASRSEAVSTTRALKPSKKKTVKSAEATLTLTTMADHNKKPGADNSFSH